MRSAVVVGFDYPSRYLAGLMNEHAKGWRVRAFPSTRFGMIRALWALRDADAIISFGGPGPSSAIAVSARQRHVPMIIIWAGTDVLVAANDPFRLEVTKREASLDLAVSPWLAEELQELGIPAVHERIIGVNVESTLAPLPSKFTVLTYLPSPRRTFYGEDKVYSIARAMKDVRFIVVGRGGHNPNAPPNVDFLGWVENTAPLIDASSVLLRLPEHDGQSMMVLEALAHGRHVVWNYNIPGVRSAHSAEDALDALRDLYERHVAGVLDINTVGRAYVVEKHRRVDVAASFEACLDRAVPRLLPPSNGQRKRVAITGYDLFCADVAKQIERLHSDWEAQILVPRSRLEMLTSLVQLTRADVWYSIGVPIGSRLMHRWARLLGIPRVLHWVGSDIEHVRANAPLRQRVRVATTKHLTEIDWTARELKDLGFESEILPLPLRHPATGVKPLPERFTIMLYVPKTRRKFYGVCEYDRLLAKFAHESPRVFVVGGGHLRGQPPSVEVIDCGWRSDLRSIYEQSTVLIRCTPHDGLSLMVLEALSFGRHVIWSQPFPDAMHVTCYREVEESLRTLIERHKQGTLRAQYAAAESVRERYATERCVSGILSAFDAVCAKNASGVA
jgi:glycosyltransferase involved in cell wall biosynthesis